MSLVYVIDKKHIFQILSSKPISCCTPISCFLLGDLLKICVCNASVQCKNTNNIISLAGLCDSLQLLFELSPMQESKYSSREDSRSLRSTDQIPLFKSAMAERFKTKFN